MAKKKKVEAEVDGAELLGEPTHQPEVKTEPVTIKHIEKAVKYIGNHPVTGAPVYE